MSTVTALDDKFEPWVLCHTSGHAAQKGMPAVSGIAPRCVGGNGRMSAGRIYVPFDMVDGPQFQGRVYHGLVLVDPRPYHLMWVMRRDFGVDNFGEELLYQCKSCLEWFVADLMKPVRSGGSGALVLTASNICRKCHSGHIRKDMSKMYSTRWHK